MKTYLRIGFFTIVLGAPLAIFAAAEPKRPREPWQLQAEAVLQASLSRLGSGSQFSLVGPDITKQIAQHLKPGCIVNNTGCTITGLRIFTILSLAQNLLAEDPAISAGYELRPGRKIPLDERSFYSIDQSRFDATSKTWKDTLHHIRIYIGGEDFYWSVDNVVFHMNSTIYVNQWGRSWGRLISITVCTPGEKPMQYVGHS